MKSTLKIVALSLLLAIGAWTLTGCGSSTETTDKMGMSDRMGDDKMGMEAPMNDAMEPMKMEGGKMEGGKMDDDKMGSN